MPITIRRATGKDAPVLSRICLLTCDAGKSGEALHDFEELPGLVYAVPFVTLPTTFGYVMVDDAGGQEEVVGYVLGTTDTREYERVARETWWPMQRARFPSVEEMEKNGIGKEQDKHYIRLLENMYSALGANVAFAPAHLHIDILDKYQRQGWGRKLIGHLIEHLAAEGINGVWLGLDPRNTEARKFYARIGFEQIEGASNGNMGITVEKWKKLYQ